MHRLEISLKQEARRSEINISRGIRRKLGHLIPLKAPRRVAIISNQRVFDLYGRDVVRSTLLAGACDVEHDRSSDALAVYRTAADALRGFARRYWTTMERPELVAILRLVVAELPRFPELAVFHATETLERFVRTLERIIERGVVGGELRAVDVRAAARSIVATLAAHALWFAYPGIYAGLTGADPALAASQTIETIVCALELAP
jgi:hypothetical protein